MGVARSKDTALGAFYRRIKSRKDASKANTATARKLAVMYYQLMTKGLDYVETGLEKYESDYKAQMLKRLQKDAKKMGFILTENTVTAAN